MNDSYVQLGALIAVGSILISFFSLFSQSVFSANRIKTKQGEVQEALEKLVSGDESAELDKIDFEDHTRLDELRALQNRYQKQARLNQMAFNLLIFAQYIIGAVLATSFAQQSISKETGSILGLLVLISTAIQQRFRPDLLATQAKNRLTRCGRITREVENGVFKIKARTPDQPSIVALRTAATQGIDDLEALELSGMESYYVQRLEVVALATTPRSESASAPAPAPAPTPEKQDQPASKDSSS